MAEEQPRLPSLMNDSPAIKSNSSDTSSSSSESTATVPNEDVCICGSCIRITNFLHLRSPRAVDAVTDDLNLTKEYVDVMAMGAHAHARVPDNEKTPLAISQKNSSRPPRYPSPPEDVQSEKLARTPTQPPKASGDFAIITSQPRSAGLSMPILWRSPPESVSLRHSHSHLISTANIDAPLLSLNSRSFARNFETVMPPAAVPLIRLKMRRRKGTTTDHHVDQDPETMDPRQTINGFVPLQQHDSGRKRASQELQFEERK